MTTLTHEVIEDLIEENCCHECEGVGKDNVCVRIEAIAELPTRFGDFHIVAFWNNRDEKEHVAIIKGEIIDGEDVPVRLHSECLTGDVIGSLRCDCRDQLETALKMIGQMDKGIVLYLRQEGRGIGLLDKLRAYNLQDEGYDTVDANILLGHQADERDYTAAAQILDDLNVRSVRLLTNNPRKIRHLKKLGVTVNERVPLESTVYADNASYLLTKVQRMNHLLSLNALSFPATGRRNGPHPNLAG